MIRILLAGLTICFAGLRADAARPLPVLHWTGTATINANEHIVRIVVDTDVMPFNSATSKSRLASEHADRTRVMKITPTSGEVTFQGATHRLSEVQADHERQQFALYGLLLITHARSRCVTVKRVSVPTTRLCFDRAGMVRSGSNIVTDPETGSPTSQSFEFEGALRSGNVVWPRRVKIYQNGRPYFDLTIDSFAVGRQ